MSLPATIRTTVSQQAIAKVTRLFNGTVADVLNELLQNARRAGATAVSIETLDLAGQPTLCVRDDGPGIADPSVLLTLGQSGWSDDTQRREDPAGMGVFSLAGHRVEIRSRASHSPAGWRIIIPHYAWEESTAIAVEPFPIAQGTEILIDMPEAWDAQVRIAAASAALHYPLPVSLNGDMLFRQDFLHGATRVEHWQGCRIGIFHHQLYASSAKASINFHGISLETGLKPLQEAVGGSAWSVRVDIVDAPQLQLVLPARKEMVANAALDALHSACKRAIYRTIGFQPAHRLSFEKLVRGARTGRFPFRRRPPGCTHGAQVQPRVTAGICPAGSTPVR